MTSALAAEWIKIRSMRSLLWSLAGAFVLLLTINAIAAFVETATWADKTVAERAAFRPMFTVLNGYLPASLFCAIAAATTVTEEYRTGMIATTFQVTPARLKVLAAKCLVLPVLVTVSGVAASCATFWLAMTILAPTGAQAHLGDPHVARMVAGGGLMFGAMALLGVGLGALLRNTAAAAGALVTVLYGGPFLLTSLLGDEHPAVRYYLSKAAVTIINHPRAHTLGPWQGYLVFLLWIAAILAVGAYLVHRKDTRHA